MNKTYTVLRTVRRSNGNGLGPGGKMTDWRIVVTKGEKCRMEDGGNPESIYVTVSLDNDRYELVRRTTLSEDKQ